MAEGATVLFVGAGMSQPGLPGWAEGLERMLAWASRQQISLAGEEDSIRDLAGMCGSLREGLARCARPST